MSRIFVTIFALLSVFQSNASILEAQIRTGSLQWRSGIESGGHLMSSQWDLPIALPTALRIVPAGPVNVGAEELLVLTGEGGEVNIPYTILGMEYRLSETPASEVDERGTATATRNGDVVKVLGAGIADKGYLFNAQKAPFSHFRPIFKRIDHAELVEAFKTADVSKGVYRGKVTSSISYEYYVNGIRNKFVLPFSFEFVINYNPAIINSVSIISGNGVISPRYYGYPQRVVGGESHYVLRADGDFKSGLKMGLRSSRQPDGHFYMKHQGTTESQNPDTKIYYNVRCSSGCIGSGDIIKDGIAQINDTNERVSINITDNDKNSDIGITISFKDKPLSELNHGTYQDSFVLVFEALL
ncbi:hypothetical protein [Vibrio alfacsensis]|uniref:hypothetical protein n=1 Tax=Vibrio alfacsensis TaxID=1074311 RepID=UPI001C7E921E|nr:hypothetical protein [Vibrio alfacsensis]